MGVFMSSTPLLEPVQLLTVPAPNSPALYPVVISFKYGFYLVTVAIAKFLACLTFNNNKMVLDFVLFYVYHVRLYILYISIWLLVFYRNHSS